MLNSATLLLIRHADVSHRASAARLCGGWCDPPLTELGRLQVELLRERLLSESPAAACYTSPLQRAVATATAAPPPLRPVQLEFLREIHCGDLDGMPLEHVQARHPEAWARNFENAADDFAWPGGETYRDFRRRSLEAMNFIASRHAGDRVLVFTHSGLISQVVGALAGTPACRWDLHRPSNASITEVRWADGRGLVTRYNDRIHLEPTAVKAS